MIIVFVKFDMMIDMFNKVFSEENFGVLCSILIDFVVVVYMFVGCKEDIDFGIKSVVCIFDNSVCLSGELSVKFGLLFDWFDKSVVVIWKMGDEIV